MLVFLNMPCMQMPEAYVGGAAGLFDGDELTEDSTRTFLQTFADKFAAWVERHAD
jgi:chromate reductase